MENIREYLEKNTLLCDGAFGTYFAYKYGSALMPEKANTEDVQKVFDIHKEYVQAGAKLVRTNTFAVNEKYFDKKEGERAIKAAWETAKKACGENAFIAADIGNMPVGCKDGYIRNAEVFADIGAKIFVFESLDNFEEVESAARFIKENVKDSFVMTQFCVNMHAYTLDGISAKNVIRKAAESEYTDAVGLNCGIGPMHMYEVLKSLKVEADKYFTAFPNSGYPTVVQKRMYFSSDKAYFTNAAEKCVKLGINIVGGCCGTTPQNIEDISKRVKLEGTRRKFDFHQSAKGEEGEEKSKKFFFEKKGKIIAVELDPPKDTNVDALMDTANFLKNKNVDVITFADSPSGRTRASSTLMSLKVKNETGIDVMPHICCRDTNAIGITAQVMGAYINGVRNFLIITGDPVPIASRDSIKNVFNFDSVKLMNNLKELNEDVFKQENICYGGALNYTGNIEFQLKRAKKKEEAGASFFLTQPVYCKEDGEKIIYLAQNLKAKVLCGIMPLVSYNNANFIKNEIAGINVPESVLNMFSPDMTKEEGRKKGIELCVDIMKQTADYVDGYYFTIPFNRLETAKQLLERIPI
ncbi:MAG: bifunctional homocysteine S-methyltransferase/methylenetetrahydrofolate reductase [Firmicutes bacterium]|nr:bifunctional homocysteine S-methyltransferase/methylenetetrahydrofolate reductase [Bacillota bacterium]